MNQPWCVQVELVEGCNRICSFCGINGIRSAPGNFKYMEMRTVEQLGGQLAELCPHARIEFAMHGEPLQHPHATGIVQWMRAVLPKAQMMLTTNGRVLAKKMQARLEALYEAGLDYVMMDTYYPERDSLREEAATLTGIVVKDFYDELAPAGWSPYANHQRKVQRWLVLMDDIGARDGEHTSRVIHNHAGSNPGKPVPREPLKKTCTKPFREVSVTWNGEVRLCCEDWIGRYVAGNINERTLRDIWFGVEFEAARAHLQNKERTFGACQHCDAGSGMRVGLLPKYGPLTDEQRAMVKAVEARTASRESLVQIRRSQ